MAYVITGTCTKDEHCIETCPVNCIHPTKDEPDFATAAQLYVNPTECIELWCVVPVCPTTSIFTLEKLPAELQEFVHQNAAYFNQALPNPPECSSPKDPVIPGAARDLLFAKCRGKRRFLTPQPPFGMTKREFFRRAVQSCPMYLPCNPALAAEGFGFDTDSIAACQFAQKWCQPPALHNNHVWGKN